MAEARKNIAIVTDGMWRKSLSAIRALGKAGYEVHVLGENYLTVGFWSRFTDKRVVLRDANDDPVSFGRLLMAYLSSLPRNRKPVLLPTEEATLEYVVRHRKAIEPFADFLVPSAESLEICLDKAKTVMLARKLGIPYPVTEVAGSPEQLLASLLRFGNNDVVVKPTRGVGSAGVHYGPCFDAQSAAEYFGKYGPCLVQERIPSEGAVLGVSVLIDRERNCVGGFCHRRLRQYPNSGGPSTDRIGIVDNDLLDLSLRLLWELDWVGVAMVEWKIDPRDNRPKLMEVNPRFWGSLELAVRSGVNFPVLYADTARESESKGPESYRTDVRCRWLIPGDILRWLTDRPPHREQLNIFLKGLPAQAEEWDPEDFRGTFASCICQGLAVFRPKYWKFLRR